MKKTIFISIVLAFAFLVSGCVFSQTKTYTNDQYGFTMKYPADWYANGGFSTFSNKKEACDKSTCGADFRGFSMNVISEEEWIKAALDRKANDEKDATTKETITTKDGEKIDFYIHRFKSGDDQGLSYPHATAYYVGDKYIVEFNIATELSGETGQEEEINSLRTSLESFSKVK